MRNWQAVFAWTSSRLDSLANSTMVRPVSGSTSKTAWKRIKCSGKSSCSRITSSVIMRPTHLRAVKGRSQYRRIFGLPSYNIIVSFTLYTFVVCSVTTITLVPDSARSIAPPIPRTIFPGMIQFAKSPRSLTSMAPRTVRSMWPLQRQWQLLIKSFFSITRVSFQRIRRSKRMTIHLPWLWVPCLDLWDQDRPFQQNLDRDPNRMMCLNQSFYTIPRAPFSIWMWIFAASLLKYWLANVGIPMPKLMYIPSYHVFQ